MNKAIFLDRDGVVNELVYHQEQEVIDSPFTPNQFQLTPGIANAIRLLRRNKYLVVLASNQPGIAKGQLSPTIFEAICNKMNSRLGEEGAVLDGAYYCMHHPEAILDEYRLNCNCRKPKPGLLLKASEELNIDLNESWFVGDNLSDIQAGKSAGCQTILLGKMKCELCNLMDEKNTRPDFIAGNLGEAVNVILKLSGE